LPLYAYDHGWATVGEMLDDAALMADNLDIQADRLDEMRAVFVKELGLSNSDIVRVPSLFEHHAGCGAAALVPAMVNLVVAEHGDDIHVFVADPFFRSDLDDLGDDPFVERFAALMPAGLRLHFVDDWDVYHLGTGEVHCGTNVIRTPQGSWWTEATHLMGGI
jgi:protein-arginine deiminase